jgi:hypothetical protein
LEEALLQSEESEQPALPEQSEQSVEYSAQPELAEWDEEGPLPEESEESTAPATGETGFAGSNIAATLSRAAQEAGIVTETNGQKASEAPAEMSQEPVVAFEPYHTIDYFASQGIKLTQDENPTDVLGKQLKSFTDWLKVMRRLPQKDREIVPDIAAERTIQTIAAHSIEGREVVTEAMAEVLAKQGMPEKAREVYRKLSLLNPDKSAYFADKIEQLKIH